MTDRKTINNQQDRRRTSYADKSQKSLFSWHVPLAIALVILVMFMSKSADSAEVLPQVQPNDGVKSSLVSNLDTVHFGQVDTGSFHSKTITLINRSNSSGTGLADNGAEFARSITIKSVFLDELDEKNYSTDFSEPRTLYPGESLGITINFHPQRNGKAPGSLFITHDGHDGVKLVRLSGTAGYADEAVAELQNRMAPGFGKSQLSGLGNIIPTSLQFGPDGRLYVASMNGQIKIYTVQRNNSNQYQVTNTEVLNQIKNIQNHNDNGSVNNNQNSRLVTGLLVTGSSASPVIYVTSSDPRIGGGASGNSTNLDTNSTILSRLKKNGNNWQKLDLVRGLPRSEENHHANGMAINANGNKLYIAMGGNTNSGATSNNFALLPEYALSAAILEVNLSQIGNNTYDLPTLNDEDRPGANDNNDPFGGNRGKNQAKIVPGGPVQVYAPGFRNPYDVIITANGKMYSWDNGPNAGWGDAPVNNGSQGNCTNGVNEPGKTRYDALHHITGQGYYGGHANPTRGNKNNKFNNSNPQSPVPSSNPVECDYRGSNGPGVSKHPLNKSLVAIPPSTNGLAEYTASNFGGAMQGDLLAAAFNNKVYRVQLNNAGTAVTSNSVLFSNVDARPLDITALGDNGQFPGTIWVADFTGESVVVFEPNDYQGNNAGSCNTNNGNGDADQDGFSNSDESANNTDPCSAADIPADADGDFISDLIDPDDDNDGINDLVDPFALDEFNGASTSLGVSYDWENNSPSAGFIANLGFSGLMVNGSDNYQSLFDLDQMTISGAAGVVTIDSVPPGDPFGGRNSQEYAFQFGVNATPSSPVFRAHTRILAPFAGTTPANWQSMGLYIGTGDQDNYLKLVANASAPQGGLQFAREVNGNFNSAQSASANVFNADSMDLYIEVNPATLKAKALYQVNINGQTGTIQTLGNDITFPQSWLTGNTSLAVGIISTSFAAQPFSATWDLIEVVPMFNGGNSPPVVNAGNNTAVTTNNPLTLNGSASDDGQPNNTLTTLWSQVSGPGTAQFSNTSSVSSTVVFSQAGVYSLMLTADDGQIIVNSTVTVTVSNAIPNPTSSVVMRINAGGPAIPAAGGNWQADNGNQTWVNTGSTYQKNVNINLSGLNSQVPAAVFKTERYDKAQNPAMHYKLPVTPGQYEVRLYFAEIYTGAQSTGARVFHVNVEGQSLSYLDVFSEAGANAALMKSFTVTSDNVLDIVFSHVTENPSIKAIEVLSLGGGGGPINPNPNPPTNTKPDADAGPNATTTVGTALNLNGSITDDGLPNGTVTSQWTKVTGPGNVTFGNATSLQTTATFSAAGSYRLRLTANDGSLGDTNDMLVSVTGGNQPPPPPPPTTQNPIRINVGGPQIVSGGKTWIADNPGTHGYVNTGNTHSYGSNTGSGNIPNGTPLNLFKTERWDHGSGADMQWSIPVQPGPYEVRLYFAEKWSGAMQVGARIFDVEVEGTSLNNLDIFASSGANVAEVHTLTVSSDNTLDIDFSHVVQNPAIKAIEIIPL